MSYTIYCFLLFPVFQCVKRDTSGKKNHKGKLYCPFLAGLPDKKPAYTRYKGQMLAQVDVTTKE